MKSEKKNLKHLKLNLRTQKDSYIPQEMPRSNPFSLFNSNIFFNIKKYYYTCCASCSNSYLVTYISVIYISLNESDVSLTLTVLFLVDVYLTFLSNVPVT